VADFRLQFVYANGPADQNRLDLYDGALSLEGISRATAIATHAFLNGETRYHGDKARGARLYLLPARAGSFAHDVEIWMSATVAGGVFYDFVKYSFLEAVGRLSGDVPEGPLQQRVEPTIGELPTVLESPLRLAHRPIRTHNEMTLTVLDAQGRPLVIFDIDTASALEPQVADLEEPITGNVTRYNTLSRWGRLYDRTQGRVVSFLLDEDVSEHERSLITWSLHERNLNREGTLEFSVSSFVTPSGHIKRYNVHKVGRNSTP
jgi:hypothetical protein